MNTPPDPSSVTLVLIYSPLVAVDVSDKVFSPTRQRLGVTRENQPKVSLNKLSFTKHGNANVIDSTFQKQLSVA